MAKKTQPLDSHQNTVLFIAKKAAGASRKSYSKEHIFRVIIGEGQMNGDHVMIDNGFLMALRDQDVVAAAKRYGDPLELLETFVE